MRFDIRLPREGHGPYRLLRGVHDKAVRSLEQSLSDPRRAQEERLAVLLRATVGSDHGRQHRLDRVRSLEELRSAMPVRTFADYLPLLDRVAAGEAGVLTTDPVSMLLETSGTSGRPKHLPVTAPWAASVAAAQSLWVLAMLRDHEGLNEGKALTIVSAAEHARSPGGLPIGSNTGRMVAAQPWWLRRRYAVPYEIFLLEPPELRQYAILRFALGERVTSFTTANPSTVLLFARRAAEWWEPLCADLAAGTLRHGPAAALGWRKRAWLELGLRKVKPPASPLLGRHWPLCTINCWKGGPAAYFVGRIPSVLGSEAPIREVGITASEGFFAIPFGADWPGGLLWTQGHVLEVIDDNGVARWAYELEPGERGRLVISTEAGLLRYDLADTIECVGRCGETPVVRFVGKSGRFLNATGEKVTEGQVSEALRVAASRIGMAPIGFTARLILGDVPQVSLFVEAPAARLSALGPAFDLALAEINIEYASKRESGRLLPATAEAAPDGTFARFRAQRVAEGAPEGQVKDPILAVDAREWGRLLAAAAPEPRRP